MLVRNAALWSGTGAAPVTAAALWTQGDRIAWVGPERELPAGAAADPLRIDAAGRWLQPGLIDLHVHLPFDPAEGDVRRYFATVPVPEQALRGAANARALLAAGFTSARDMGGFGYAAEALKRAIDRGWVAGPRLATSGSPLTVVGGHLDWVFRPDLDVSQASVLSGPEEVRRAVRIQVRYGADWIKVLATGGVLSGGTSLRASLWEAEELRTAVSAARRLGKPVAAHCHGADGMLAAAEAGVTTIEHGTMGDEAAAAAMARQGVVLVPTFCAAAAVVREAKAGTLPPAVAAQALEIEPRHDASFRAACAAGVRIACGTDTGVPGSVFGENARELGHMVAHGLTPEEALLAATRDASAVLGWTERVGTLEPGKLADFLLVDGTPLDHVEHLAEPQRLHLVVKGGEIAVDRRPSSG